MNIDQLRTEAEPDKVAEKRLSELVLAPWFRKVLGKIVREMDGKKSQLLEVDFASDEGVKKAMKLQGEVAGMARVLDLLDEGVSE